MLSKLTFNFSDHTCVWQPWLNTDTNPGGKGDIETMDTLRIKHPTKSCPSPYFIEARSTSTFEMVQDPNSPQNFDACNTVNGFSCLNADNPSLPCHDYEVRLCCPRKCVCRSFSPPAAQYGPAGIRQF